MLLEEAVWWHQGGYWRPEPVKRNVRRHRTRPGGERVGSEEGSLWKPSEAHLAAQLCATQWMRAGLHGVAGLWGPLKGCWGYVFRELVEYIIIS